jgi:hypothetical protein
VLRLAKLAAVSDGATKKDAINEALKIVERLDAEGKLSPEQKDWKERLVTLRNGQQAP